MLLQKLKISLKLESNIFMEEYVVMSIGYACLTLGVPNAKYKSCTMKSASSYILMNLIQSNLEALDNALSYNIQNSIKLFRISSDIIPFGSHPINKVKWWEIYENQLSEIGCKAINNGMRLSMHPGQYTVLNSLDDTVVGRAVEDLRYHTKFLDSLGLPGEHKIVLHIGGTYGDKKAAVERFIKNYRALDENIRSRLVIENDDKQYKISEVLNIGRSEGIPVVFDNLHHKVNPDNTYSEVEWIEACAGTWKECDGLQKLHYSQQDAGKRLGSHSQTINLDEFYTFYNQISKHNIDIMLEVKDKNLSAIKCINATSSPDITKLEREWSRYKYLVLEHSQQIYNKIRQLLKDKKAYPVIEFYRLIDEASLIPVKPGNAINAAEHVWGYFKEISDEKIRKSFDKSIQKLSMGDSSTPVKRVLWKLVNEHQQKYLLDSLYFIDLF